MASVNEKFIWIAPQSGYRMAVLDLLATERLLAPHAGDDAVGDAIKGAIAESRFLSLEEARGFQEIADSLYPQWIERLMLRYNYKSKQALFKK